MGSIDDDIDNIGRGHGFVNEKKRGAAGPPPERE
jgi:hypothetical protein